MKKKILLLSDDLRMTSGVATVSKEIVLGTVHKYDWVQLGAAINHPENGKIVDLNKDIRERTGVQDADVKIIPYNGYGDILMLRRLIKQEKPDAILHFTDPHYWQWLYDNEHEIRQEVPVLYYHIWDDLPDPKYNRDYYESCDWIGCISKQTYGIVNRVGKLKDHITYKPLEDWQIYRCLLLMHTSPVDTNGTDLNAVVNDLCPEYNVKFTNMKVEPDVLNNLYNIVDCTINIANNEGFGLTTAESLMSGTPIIANVTGGLQDQMGLNENGKEFSADDYVKFGTLHDKTKWGHLNYGEWVVPVWSSAHNINGSPATPYIFDDRVNDYDVADAIMKVYNWSREERKRRGVLGREFMLKNLTNKIMCESMIDGIETTSKNYTPKRKYELYKIV